MFFKRKKDYSSLTRYDREKRSKCENYTLLNEKFVLKNQTILLGDSITELFNWYELFYEFSKQSNQAVYNRGISGDTTDRLLERLDTNVLNACPKNLVLLIGTNDIGRGLPLSISLKNVDGILKKMKENLPEINIIFQAVYPINSSIRGKYEKRSARKINAMNREFIKLSEKYGCVWLDLTKELSDENGQLNHEYTYDGLHINVKAYEIIAGKVIPLLKK